MAKQLHLDKLDAIRGFAATYVVLHHFVEELPGIPESIKRLFFSFGQEVVMVFFLLSGFVIYWSIQNTSHLSFKSYFIKRFRRIYFPFLIAILISIVVFFLSGKLTGDFSGRDLIGNLLMLQDFSEVKPGTWFSPFLANYPLWSLSYEWWFYMMFFPCYKLLSKNPNRIYLILAFSAISLIFYMIYPNQVALIFSYYIIWWSGVEAADIYIHQGRFTHDNMRPIIFALTLMLALTIVPVLNTEKIQFGYYPFLTFRHFLAALLVILVGLFWYQFKLLYFDKILGGFTAVASISYGLYILHYPLLKYLNLHHYVSNLWISYAIKFFLIVGLAYLTEIKLQPLVNKWLRAN